MICTICRHDLSGFDATMLECGHFFHSECLINHFRCPREWAYSSEGYGTCPLCRSGPLGGKPDYSHCTTKGRVSIIRALARQNNLHPKIKKTIDQLKGRELYHTEAKKEHKEFRKKHKDILKQDAKLRNNIWKAHNKVWKAKSELASFDPITMLDNPNTFID